MDNTDYTDSKYIKATSNFLRTNDESTKQYLLSHGFQFLIESGGVSVFINKPTTLSFEEIENKDLKITYSNVLTF